MLNSAAPVPAAFMVPRERQREEMAPATIISAAWSSSARRSCIRRSTTKGCSTLRAGAITWFAPRLRSPASAEPAARGGSRPRAATLEAGDVVIATNGYTGDLTPALKRRVVPVASHIIATEELPTDLARSLIPKGRTLSDTRRVLCYYRMSPDGKRVVFGGRARFTQVDATVSAPILHRFMTDRFPELRGVKVTHAWTGNVAFTLDALPHMGRATACIIVSAATAAVWR